MQEIWKDIKDYEGIYQISNLGRVKSLKRKWRPKELILGLTIDSHGYYKCTLRKDNVQRIQLVHILVAQHFIPNPENKPQVNHKNGIKTDASVGNLEWVTDHENKMHAHENGLSNVLFKKGSNNPTSKLSDEDVAYIKNNYVSGSKEFGQHALGKKFNVSKTAIYKIVHGKLWNN